MADIDERSQVRPTVLTGRRIYLRPMTKEDLVYLRKWLEDAEIRALIGETKPMSQADSERWLD